MVNKFSSFFNTYLPFGLAFLDLTSTAYGVAETVNPQSVSVVEWIVGSVMASAILWLFAAVRKDVAPKVQTKVGNLIKDIVRDSSSTEKTPWWQNHVGGLLILIAAIVFSAVDAWTSFRGVSVALPHLGESVLGIFLKYFFPAIMVFSTLYLIFFPPSQTPLLVPSEQKQT